VKIYLASSWRNGRQPMVVETLRNYGHEVYDFRNPRPGDKGFSWGDIAAQWQGWDGESFREGLKHPVAQAGFKSDFDAMQWADAGVLLLPCGRSAHLEAGYFNGAGKKLFILLDQKQEPELMYLMASSICCDLPELVYALGKSDQNLLPSVPANVVKSFTYLAAPYSHPDPLVRIARFEAINRAAYRLMLRGEVVFSPISHSHPIEMESGQINSHEFWAKQDDWFEQHCSKVAVLMMDGWRESKGTQREIRMAEELGKEIEYLPACFAKEFPDRLKAGQHTGKEADRAERRSLPMEAE
jgi:hypothetical protein